MFLALAQLLCEASPSSYNIAKADKPVKTVECQGERKTKDFFAETPWPNRRVGP